MCSNCQKRHAECEYDSSSPLLWANKGPSAHQSSRASGFDSGLHGDPSPGSPGADSLGLLGRLSSDSSTPAAPAGLNLHDLELMTQWCNATFRTLSSNDRTDTVWRNAVPEEGLSHPFLMHGILALSSLHLARTAPETSRRAAYLNRAVVHQNQALALFRELLGDVNEGNAKAMFAFASIVVVYTFGFPHTPDVQDPWTCVDDLYQVLILTRGIQQVIRSSTGFLGGGRFAPILQVDGTPAPLPEDATTAIRHLHEANEVCRARDPHQEMDAYTVTIDNLAEMLSWIYSGKTSIVSGQVGDQAAIPILGPVARVRAFGTRHVNALWRATTASEASLVL